MDLRLGLDHTPEGVWRERHAKWPREDREGFVRGKIRGDPKNNCEKRYLGLLRHVWHYHGKNMKNLLQGEGRGCPVVGLCGVGVDWLVSHGWRE